MNEIGISAQGIMSRLIYLVDEDTKAFNEIIKANRLPNGTAEQKRYKDRRITYANNYAIEIPLKTAKLSLKVLELSVELVKHGYLNSVSDSEVAAEVGLAGVRGACMNVLINISGSKKTEHKKLKKEIDLIIDKACAIHKKVFNDTKKMLFLK